MDKPDKVSKFTGWATVKRCSYEGKMYQDVFPCYTPDDMALGVCRATAMWPRQLPCGE